MKILAVVLFAALALAKSGQSSSSSSSSSSAASAAASSEQNEEKISLKDCLLTKCATIELNSQVPACVRNCAIMPSVVRRTFVKTTIDIRGYTLTEPTARDAECLLGCVAEHGFKKTSVCIGQCHLEDASEPKEEAVVPPPSPSPKPIDQGNSTNITQGTADKGPQDAPVVKK